MIDEVNFNRKKCYLYVWNKIKKNIYLQFIMNDHFLCPICICAFYVATKTTFLKVASCAESGLPSFSETRKGAFAFIVMTWLFLYRKI